MLPNWFPTSTLHTWRSLAHSQVSTDFPVVSLVSHFSWFTLFMTFYKSLPFHFLSTAKSYLHPPLPVPWQLALFLPVNFRLLRPRPYRPLSLLSLHHTISCILRNCSPCTKHPMA